MAAALELPSGGVPEQGVPREPQQRRKLRASLSSRAAVFCEVRRMTMGVGLVLGFRAKLQQEQKPKPKRLHLPCAAWALSLCSLLLGLPCTLWLLSQDKSAFLGKSLPPHVFWPPASGPTNNTTDRLAQEAPAETSHSEPTPATITLRMPPSEEVPSSQAKDMLDTTALEVDTGSANTAVRQEQAAPGGGVPEQGKALETNTFLEASHDLTPDQAGPGEVHPEQVSSIVRQSLPGASGNNSSSETGVLAEAVAADEGLSSSENIKLTVEGFVELAIDLGTLYLPQTTEGMPPDGSKRRPRRVVINYAKGCCVKSQKNNCVTAIQHGADMCIAFNINALSAEFAQRNNATLQQPRGAGYWIWKPYLILKFLMRLDDGDIVMLSDAGQDFARDAKHMFELAERNEHSVALGWALEGRDSNKGHKNKDFTKRDTFLLVGCTNETQCADGWQLQASLMAFQKTEAAEAIAAKWLAYLQDPRATTDIPNTLGQPDYAPGVRHRHDQSLLSLIAIMHGVDCMRSYCCEGLEFQTVYHHRNKERRR